MRAGGQAHARLLPVIGVALDGWQINYPEIG